MPFKLPSTPAPELEPTSLPTFTQIAYENGVLQATVTSRTRERLGDEIGTDGRSAHRNPVHFLCENACSPSEVLSLHSFGGPTGKSPC